MNNPTIKAVLFDMDGTITDTERVYNKNWVEAAHKMGWPQFTRQDALDLRSGFTAHSTKLMQDRFGPEFDYDAIHTVCGQMVDAELERDGIDLKPGIHEILSFLHERGIKAAVVTATGIERATARLKLLGLYDEFDAVISAHFVKLGKPNPDPYLYACKEIDEDPANCFAVEDAPNGVRSAYRAGCNVIMVPDLTEPDDELNEMLYARVDSLDKIIDLF